MVPAPSFLPQEMVDTCYLVSQPQAFLLHPAQLILCKHPITMASPRVMSWWISPPISPHASVVILQGPIAHDILSNKNINKILNIKAFVRVKCEDICEMSNLSTNTQLLK